MQLALADLIKKGVYISPFLLEKGTELVIVNKTITTAIEVRKTLKEVLFGHFN